MAAPGGAAPPAQGGAAGPAASRDTRLRDVKETILKVWVEPWKELAGDVASNEMVAKTADMANEMFLEPWREMGKDFVEAAKPLAQRATTAAAAAIRAPPLPVGTQLPPSQQPQPPHAPPRVPSPRAAAGGAANFPPPPTSADASAAPRSSISRPPVPGAPAPPPPPQRTYFQGGQQMSPLEIQRAMNAERAAALQRQHYAQHMARPPLPSGAVLIGAPAAPSPAAVAEARRAEAAARDAAARAAAQHAHSGGVSSPPPPQPPRLSQTMDDMFSVIETLPRGISTEAEDWAAVQVAESARSRRTGTTAGAHAAIAAAAYARTAGGAVLPPPPPADGPRSAGEAAEAARQRLAALRGAHPDALPLNAKTLYTPWRDDGAGAGGADVAGGGEAEEEEEAETHCVASLLGPRWRVRLAALLFIATFGVYLRGERAGWGVEGTAGGLLEWHAGDDAAAGAPPGQPQHGGGMALVVRAPDRVPMRDEQQPLATLADQLAAAAIAAQAQVFAAAAPQKDTPPEVAQQLAAEAEADAARAAGAPASDAAALLEADADADAAAAVASSPALAPAAAAAAAAAPAPGPASSSSSSAWWGGPAAAPWAQAPAPGPASWALAPSSDVGAPYAAPAPAPEPAAALSIRRALRTRNTAA